MKTRLELEQENIEIQGELAEIREQLLAKQTELDKRDSLISQLKELILQGRQSRFGVKTESLSHLQQSVFNEAEVVELQGDTESSATESQDADDTITVPAHQRRRGGRKPLPAELPRIEVIHDLSDDEKVCPEHGTVLKPMADKVSEQLDIIPMQIRVIQHVRKQYHCPCCEGLIKTALKPKQPIPKSQASAGLLATIATQKYADGLPLYRQNTIFKRVGVDIDRTTMATWIVKCGQLVQPLINRIEEVLLSANYLHMDETPVQVLNEAGKTAQSKSYMWVRCAGPPGPTVDCV